MRERSISCARNRAEPDRRVSSERGAICLVQLPRNRVMHNILSQGTAIRKKGKERKEVFIVFVFKGERNTVSR
jgi:hypothetical protein